MLNWHQADSHCHTLTGPVTHEEFMSALQTADPANAACMLVQAPAEPRRDVKAARAPFYIYIYIFS